MLLHEADNLLGQKVDSSRTVGVHALGSRKKDPIKIRTWLTEVIMAKQCTDAMLTKQLLFVKIRITQTRLPTSNSVRIDLQKGSSSSLQIGIRA